MQSIAVAAVWRYQVQARIPVRSRRRSGSATRAPTGPCRRGREASRCCCGSPSC